MKKKRQPIKGWQNWRKVVFLRALKGFLLPPGTAQQEQSFFAFQHKLAIKGRKALPWQFSQVSGKLIWIFQVNSCLQCLLKQTPSVFFMGAMTQLIKCSSLQCWHLHLRKSDIKSTDSTEWLTSHLILTVTHFLVNWTEPNSTQYINWFSID